MKQNFRIFRSFRSGIRWQRSEKKEKSWADDPCDRSRFRIVAWANQISEAETLGPGLIPNNPLIPRQLFYGFESFGFDPEAALKSVPDSPKRPDSDRNSDSEVEFEKKKKKEEEKVDKKNRDKSSKKSKKDKKEKKEREKEKEKEREKEKEKEKRKEKEKKKKKEREKQRPISPPLFAPTKPTPGS